ncbi:MAG: glycosyltransferase, TIGR04372 family protein, partial [Actinobacteria bacterium]|nr:glycosyltransferase, TIGR04372 family protein [Actinomycetota bacterium]
MAKQIKRMIRLIVSVPLALVFVIVIRVIRPFILVRIGAMRSDRIG